MWGGGKRPGIFICRLWPTSPIKGLKATLLLLTSSILDAQLGWRGFHCDTDPQSPAAAGLSTIPLQGKLTITNNTFLAAASQPAIQPQPNKHLFPYSSQLASIFILLCALLSPGTALLKGDIGSGACLVWLSAVVFVPNRRLHCRCWRGTRVWDGTGSMRMIIN